jgi:hypothetical protein
VPKFREDLVGRCEELIRGGATKEAKALFQRVKLSEVPRRWRDSWARLAYRLSLPEAGLLCLHPFVRSDKRSASREEMLTYASLLVRAGAVHEGRELLDTLDPKDLPRADLYGAFACFKQWDYGEAIPKLLRYTKAAGLSKYEQTVGLVNLAAAYVTTGALEEARALLEKLEADCREAKYQLLLGNLFEISAQRSLFAGDLAAAESCLEKAESYLSATDTLDALFVKKWRAVLNVARSRGAEPALGELRGVRALAAVKLHFETVRECDFYLAFHTKDPGTLGHLYFGTPYAPYRERIETRLGYVAPLSFAWRLGEARASSLSLDLGAGVCGKESMEPGSLLHRTLSALCQDFYRPMRTPELSAVIYPEELFNPGSSPVKVRQALKRLRALFARTGIAIDVARGPLGYQLTALEPTCISVPKVLKFDPPSKITLERLEAKWGTRAFSVNEAAAFLGVSPRSALRYLAEGCHQGTCAREGRSIQTKFRFLSPAPASKKAS